MPSLLSTDEIREHVDTDLSDTALQLLIDAADADLVRTHGPHATDGSVVEHHNPRDGDRYVFLRRPADGAVVVTRTYYDDAPAVVDATEYRLDAPRKVALLGCLWGYGPVTVAYTSTADLAARRSVLMDLVRLAIRYEAASSTRMGDAQVSHVEYEPERARILARLDTGVGSFA